MLARRAERRWFFFTCVKALVKMWDCSWSKWNCFVFIQILYTTYIFLNINEQSSPTTLWGLVKKIRIQMYIPISESQIGNTDDGTKKKKRG